MNILKDPRNTNEILSNTYIKILPDRIEGKKYNI